MKEAAQAGQVRSSWAAQIKPLVRTMRPSQYTKNVFVWAALVADRKLFDFHPFVRTLLAFVLFCLISSAVYIINDLVDIEKDRLHPKKCSRPLPSGTLSPRVAMLAAVILILAAAPVSLWLNPAFFGILYSYLALMLGYSLWLKNLVIVDVLIISLGFVMRVAAGVVVVAADNFSPWIYVCMFLLALFLAIGKRRQEIVLIGNNGGSTRGILVEYNVRFLDEMLSLVTSTTMMAYSLYTFSAEKLPPDHAMMLTIPFVLYGLFRYLYLIHVRGETDPPDVVALKDRPLQITLVAFVATVVAVFYLLPTT